MSDEPSYFLVPASSGLCIQLKNGTIYTAEPNGSTEQQWFIEKGEGGQIAFRNNKDGQYLRAVGGGKGARVVTGQKQYWSLESSNTPNAFWIKCVDYPNAYLCNSYGKWSINNLIYIWAHELRWTQTMLWYVSDFATWEEHKNSKPGFDPRKPRFSELESKEKSVEDKIQKLGAREIELEEALKKQQAAQKEIEEKQKSQEAKDQELREKEKKAESEATQKAEEKEKQLAEKLKELDAKAKELAKKEERLGRQSSKEAGQDPDNSSRKLDEQRKELETREKALAHRRSELDDREAKFERERKAFQKQSKSSSDATDGDLGAGSVRANRVQSTRKELEAASVGRRDAPLRLRTSQRNVIEKGESRPITMPTNFVHLPRLRAG